MDYRDSMRLRLQRRKDKLISYIDKLIRKVDAGILGGEPGRIWLDQFAIGNGVNLCCGDFPIGDSLGIDGDPAKIAIDIWGLADHYTGELDPLDFVVTNYLECFPDPLGILKSWSSRIRQGGVFAAVACNVDRYENFSGPLANPRRLNCFSPAALKFYFERAGFIVKVLELEDKEIRIMGEKA